ncbi:BamA/TamA family outer membrane protein [Hymenobacter guriensis]|uniref:BamA/TamA family outer membrane protein n=1 Tax=Hymenobacter guriensis TaxID=2793065 RepID=A0ABS0L2E3_9BACT|nr:BamA/TamA family outer membrane protein [Hymenobacter guriensis]MBG8554256.1 BamA/TamA family outer membrane protein [Hymenobacter guriensis]
MRILTLLLAALWLAPAALAQTTPIAADSATVAPVPAVTAVEPAPAATASATAVKPPKNPADKPSFIPAPVLFYEPETGFAAGATFLPTWRHGRDTTVRKSNGRLGGWFSQKKQLNLQLSHTIFTRQERYLLIGDIQYFDYPIFFYGVGNDTKKEDESEIAYKLLTINQRALKSIHRYTFLGLQYRFADLRSLRPKLELNNEETGPNLYYSELTPREKEPFRISGAGPTFIYDSRDVILSTFKGAYLDLQALFNLKGLGSDYTFTRYVVDGRYFQPLGSNRTIWASQVIGTFHNGTVPFRELGNLGGVSLLRGIYEGRFRDRQLLAAQTEIRHHLFWRLNGAVFAGVGQVAPHLQDMSFSGIKLAGGAGVRFQFNRRDRLNIRFDYGVGSGGNSGLYFGVNEAF